MQKLIYLLFLSCFLPEYLFSIGAAPRLLTYLPEVLSIMGMAAVVFYGLRNKEVHLPPAYTLLFLFIGLHLVFGILANHVSTTTIFAGSRTYLKYLPFFFLPVVYEFSDKQLRRQLALLLALAILQLPVAAYQRFVLSAGLTTGDLVGGTLGGGGLRGSGLLTVFLMCAVTILVSFYLKQRIKGRVTIVALLVLVIPTMLNETKVTVFILPIALLAPALFLGESVGQKFKQLATMGALAVALFSLFVPIYNQFTTQGSDKGIVEFFTTGDYLQEYLLKDEKLIERGEVRGGRLNAILLPLEVLSEDPVMLMLGVGMGNISPSSLGEKFSGKYYDEYGAYTYGSMSVLLWEVGLIGVALALGFCYMVFRDSVSGRTAEGVKGDIALGWIGVVLIITLTLFYTNIVTSNAISYIFWFYSGYVVSMVARRKGCALVQ